MKNLGLFSIVVLLLFGCGNQNKKQQEAVEQPVAVLTVDELYEKAAELADKEVVVKGTVMHVCKQGGGRCFLMGSNEDVNIRVEAGEKIGAFNQEQMGSELEIVGILKEVKTEADAHNPGKEHGEEGTTEPDSATNEAHRIIAESQETAEVVYFIEGLTVKESKLETK
ncbi:MAG TPA: hypothetical protein VLQ91_01795 [Draconibacterium sp.]|nr:hypothetical protein [Draconibacterium sp.]